MTDEQQAAYAVQANGANGDHANGQFYVDTKPDPNLDGAEQSPQSEWDRLWDAVHKNPDDFASWESLLYTAQSEEGGITKESSEGAQNKLRTVYDPFLAKFPLCFGYWKKYADCEYALEGAEKAAEIFERGVVSIHNSVELWTQYCTLRIENFPDDEASIRGLFERGADQVGNDFLSHPFWDKYLEYEESKGNHSAVMSILERVIHIPMHQYARYFERYSTLSASRPVTELVSPEEYAKIEEEVRNPPPQEGEESANAEPQPKTDEQIQGEIRQRIHAIKSAIYMSTQEAVSKRWVYEGEIKRAYFHVKPLDEGQLVNWRRYLDFEETEGNQARIYTLYERCLVPCALYEEFWQRYVRFLFSRDDQTGARNVYIRATSIFIPATRPSMRLSYAAFEEEDGRIEEARAIYTSVLQQVPGHLESITKFAHFERRQAGVEKALGVISDALTTAPNDESKAYLEVLKARIHSLADGGADEARKIYRTAAEEYKASKFLLLSYLLFETQQNDSKSALHARQAWDTVKASSLAPEEKREIGLRYVDYLSEHSDSVADVNKVELEVYREFMDKAGEASRKRAADVDAGHRPVKQLRSNSAVTMQHHQSPATPVGAAPYYPPQPAVAAYNAYAYPPQQGYNAGYYGAANGNQSWDYSQQAAGGY
ncbi:putative mRNA splicing protein [Powellomyces hirtus]|nr:putative mRNA splicing protein [Powellomyces hirtus]